MSETDEMRRLLLGMKEHIVAGWVQGKMWNENGVCIYGAMVRASGVTLRRDPVPHYSFDDCPAALLVASMLRDSVGGVLLNVWNDERGRTQADVVALIDNALARLAAQEEVLV